MVTKPKNKQWLAFSVNDRKIKIEQLLIKQDCKALSMMAKTPPLAGYKMLEGMI